MRTGATSSSRAPSTAWNWRAIRRAPPLTCRPDWRPAKGKPGADLDQLRAQALDAFDIRLAICNPLYGGQVAFSETMGAALCHAVNEWIAREWLDREPRLRASIVVTGQSPELAAEEIEHRAADHRFVQVLLLASSELMLGRRYHWPIYRAAERFGLPIGIHAGSMYRYADHAERLAHAFRAGLRGQFQPVREPAPQPDLRRHRSANSQACASC